MSARLDIGALIRYACRQPERVVEKINMGLTLPVPILEIPDKKIQGLKRVPQREVEIDLITAKENVAGRK